MKKIAVFFTFVLLFTGASCDTTQTTAIRISTGSSTRAVPGEVTSVRIAAFREHISPEQLVAVAQASIGETITMIIPKDTNIELFAASLTSDGDMAPYYGTGYYDSDYKPEPGAPPANLVTIYIEQATYSLSDVSHSNTPIPEHFKLTWDYTSFSTQMITTGLFYMQIERGINSDGLNWPDDLQTIGVTQLQLGYYDDQTFLAAEPDTSHYYWYTGRLVIPALGLASATPDPLRGTHPDNI